MSRIFGIIACSDEPGLVSSSSTAVPGDLQRLANEGDEKIRQTLAYGEALFGKGLLVATPPSLMDIVTKSVNTEQIVALPDDRGITSAFLQAALYLEKIDPEAIVTLFNTDHQVQALDLLRQSLIRAAKMISTLFRPIALGMETTAPYAGINYLHVRADPKNRDAEGKEAFIIDRLLGKPENGSANGLFHDVMSFWDSGLLVCEPSQLISSLQSSIDSISHHNGDSSASTFVYQARKHGLGSGLAEEWFRSLPKMPFSVSLLIKGGYSESAEMILVERIREHTEVL